MASKKIVFLLTAVSTLAIAAQYFYFSDEPDPLLVLNEKNSLAFNDPVYLSGCQAYPRSKPLKHVYPAVKTNYITRLCALEVFPSNQTISLFRSRTEQAETQAGY